MRVLLVVDVGDPFYTFLVRFISTLEMLNCNLYFLVVILINLATYL
jgi:hypothetical protein